MLQNNQGLCQEIRRKKFLKHFQLTSRTKERISLVLNTRSQEKDLLLPKGRRTCQRFNVMVVKNLDTLREIVLKKLTARRERENTMLP